MSVHTCGKDGANDQRDWYCVACREEHEESCPIHPNHPANEHGYAEDNGYACTCHEKEDEFDNDIPEIPNVEGIRYYGDTRTIHNTDYLHVEVSNGKVVAVWFRCCMLPFKQVDVDKQRARDMMNVKDLPAINGIGLVDDGK